MSGSKAVVELTSANFLSLIGVHKLTSSVATLEI